MIIDRQRGDWVVRPLFIRRSNVEIVLADGVTVRAQKNEFKAIGDSLVKICGVASNVVLHGEPGQILKTGEIDGLIGTSVIESIEEKDGGFTVRAKVSHDRESLRPWVDLVLAPPRPRVMKRLLPQLATMGVGRIVLVGAKKVEKDFLGATLLIRHSWRCCRGSFRNLI